MSHLLKVEWRKQRKGVLLVPILLCLILLPVIGGMAFSYLIQNDRTVEQVWAIIYETFHLLWSYVVIIAIVIYAALVVDVEHRSGMWPSVLLYPYAKWKHFFIKVLWVFILVQLFGLISWVSIATVSLLYGGVESSELIAFGTLLYLPFLLALPFVIFQTFLSVVLSNSFVSMGIGMFVFLFHNLLPSVWLPWGSMIQPFLEGQPVNVVDIIFLMVGAALYTMISLFFFERKTFSTGVE
ncbi:ABC transporter permease [Halalkalibacterium halodurans]|uniref:ABC transporter permease n=1 Tax=Halalkalibacterium halodurans TaxID=86665 RepID=UPI002E251C7C|nr:ABC transporter permease [Halalkalibacterium halodurans]MED4085749.1 ABC transporter permease [Halalkalibacterium halodurans]MED4105615.1 ABC transporter permease [Halalkalibacterium halodurans]MED4107512.1 ABC transporter permease [Halalkalibacterium halodurans]MED4149474.1 ABC transporter permease [Halalkalibacterium halodurans]